MKVSVKVFGDVVIIYFSLFRLAFCQNTDNETEKAISDIFKNPVREGDLIPGFEEVTSTTSGSVGALSKCGEGTDQGIHVCVPYYQCDGDTNKIVQEYDGRHIIDVRGGGPSSCDDYLEVCCEIPRNSEKNTDGEDNIPVNRHTTLAPTSSSTRTVVTPTTPTASSLSCGIKNDNGIDFKITGNSDNEAEYGEFPWMVAILKTNYDRFSNDNLSVGGGSLLSLSVVLTGAHIVNLYKTSDLKVRAGEWDSQTVTERFPYQERNIARKIVHDNFNPKSVFNNVALLILERPFDMASHIGSICLPRQGENINSRNCYVTGWGKDVFGKAGKYQVILKKIELPIVPFDKCQDDLRHTRLGRYFQLHNSFLCAGGKAGKDACTGDGGGPLVCPDPQNPRRYVQAGIVSWGIGCGEQNIPGVYTNVAKFRNWIDENLSILNIDNSAYL